MDALEPLKQRYTSQHYSLRKFYYECSNLKYLTGLINVPKLGQVSWYFMERMPIHLSITRNPLTSLIQGMPQTFPLVQKQG